MTESRILFLITFSSLLVTKTQADDWPMWRHDIHRSGVASNEIPRKLELAWSRQLKAPQPAWPASQFKLQFDAGYEPVCADGKLLIGSSVDGSLTAYDINTGKQLWQYFSDGPIRFAPTVVEKTVYFVSDDGYLYCLDLKSGDRVWSVLGGPNRRRVIGNEKLTSMWPARGGVVVEEGVAYFASGIWPSMGIFIKAVDANSGDVLWTNSTTGSRFVTHPHGAQSFGSISPQGYLAISGDNLIVPGGRTLPGVFDKKTGELKHFEFGGKGEGGYEVIASAEHYFLSGEMFRANDGVSLSRIQADVVGVGSVVSHSNTKIAITSLAGKVTERKGKDRRGKEITTASFEPESSTEFAVIGPTDVRIRAGNSLIAAQAGRLAIYDISSSKKSLEPIWSTDVEGEIWSVITADNHLVATTKRGGVYCFGVPDVVGASLLPISIQTEEKSFSLLADENDDKEKLASSKQIRRHAKKLQGHAVSIGLPSFHTVNEIVENSQLKLIAVSEESKELHEFRKLAVQDKRFGDRVFAIDSDFSQGEFPAFFASLIFCETNRPWSQGEIETLYKSLRPYGGSCCLVTSDEQHRAIETHTHSLKLYGAKVVRDGNSTILSRQGPLEDAGVWTHQYGDASSSGISEDARVKTPLGLLWFGGPSNDKVLPRHGHGPSPQVAGGRLFIEGADMLRCVDVYTGRLWWERDFPGLGEYYNNTAHHPGAGEIGSNYVSLEDHVYVIYGEHLLELDAQSSETTREFQIPGNKVNAWGALRVEGDVLVVAASPVSVPGAESNSPTTTEVQGNHIIAPHAKWRYLAGNDPENDWIKPEFDHSKWKVGEAGFGYGDNDDKTVLGKMRGNFTRVYIRKEFELPDKTNFSQLELHLNFDDAFVAYINGHEVRRVNVSKGSGAKASEISSHEAKGHEVYSLKEAAKWLKPGKNVIAVEGHNVSKTSSDFSLDPFLVEAVAKSPIQVPQVALGEALKPERFSSASRTLMAFDRHSGELLWSRDAESNFRHNAICAAGDLLFCIDKLSKKKLDTLKRRGVTSTGKAKLLALDLKTGKVRWSQDENVFGTFLSYSKEHDVLLQGGSSYRDRAKDEVSTGLIAYQGKNGEVLWKEMGMSYGGPCLLHGDQIITNGGGGFEIDLLTGKKTGWDYSRMYGCNTAIGSKHLLTFRSGAAGFCDLTGDSGTGNFGGFRSSCTSNLIVADGVLNAPDYTRTCVCAYQLQTSLALIHMPEMESWTFGNEEFLDQPTSRFGINLGAPGDHRADDGLLWFEYPVVGGPSPKLNVETYPKNPETFGQHSSFLDGQPLNWVGASGLRGIERVKITAKKPEKTKTVTVRFVFAEPDQVSSNDRVFDVHINGEEVLTNFNIHRSQLKSGKKVIIRDISDVPFSGALDITLSPEPGSLPPVLSGVAIIAE